MVSNLECANALRILSIDAVENAQSGHPGMPMGMADIAQVLWQTFLRHNPENPQWPNRDRFVLSNGHGSMLLYALLHLSGYALSIEDLKQFRKLHSKTPGHPEYGCTPGVETTTGPLGQGLGNAVGMALAEALLSAEFNETGHSIIDHYTYCFVGDGCLMEGISHEVASLAGTLGLGKLIVFWDNNGISIDGRIAPWCSEDTGKRFEAYGWQVIGPIDGHHAYQIRDAIVEAQQNKTQPTLINCKTVIGFGAPETLAGTERCHGSALGEVVIAAVREGLGWKDAPFVIPEAIYAAWNASVKGSAEEATWQVTLASYQAQFPEKAQQLQDRLNHPISNALLEKLDVLMQEVEKKQKNSATRLCSQQVLEYLIPQLPALIGGSADLSESNLTHTVFSKAISKQQWQGNYIHYGVREFGMSTIMNGLALHGGFIPYGGTFLTFLDYARNAVRLACLMKLGVIFIYTHDSIGLGEDGPTHQPIEHLNLLRTTPNMSVWRPCDATETVMAWRSALARTTGPTSLVLSRQVLPHQVKDEKALLHVSCGGYILVDCINPNVIIIATGSEVSLAVAAAKELMQYRVRVVSMPSVDIFESQSLAYQESVLPPSLKARVAIEAGSTAYWYRWVGLEGAVVGIDRYGESAPGPAVFKALGITVEAVVKAVKGLKNVA